MRPASLLALALAVAGLSGCATRALKDSTEFWMWRELAEHKVESVLAADVSLDRWGSPRTVRVRVRSDSGELVDYYEDGAGEAKLDVSRRGFAVTSEFRTIGDTPCVLLEGQPDEPRLPVETLVRHVDPKTGAVDPVARPLTLAEGARAIFVFFLPRTGKLWVSTPPANQKGRRIDTDEQGRAFVSLEKDGGRVYGFEKTTDYGYVRNEAAVAWFYAHLPLTLAFDACLLPFSAVGTALHAAGMDETQAPIFGPDRDPVASPLTLPERKKKDSGKPWEPPGPPISLQNPDAQN